MEEASPGKLTLCITKTDMENYKKIAHSFQGSRGCFMLAERYLGKFADFKRPAH